MATLKPELRQILDRYGIDPRDTSQVWDCRGTLVLYHKAYEIIAAKESIAFDPPTVIRSDKTEAVVLVVGHMDKRSEWSFGEAVVGQNYQVSGKQAAYPWAMAEKRAKDRVIAKLVGLAAYVYSEDEADEFKNGERKPATDDRQGTAEQREAPHVIGVDMLPDGSGSDWKGWAEKVRLAVHAAETVAEVNEWMEKNATPLKNLEKASAPAAKFLREYAEKRRGVLAQAPGDRTAA